MDLRLQDRVIMVAASSRGLGYAVARAAALEGAKVSMGSRSARIDDAADSIRDEAGSVVYSCNLDVMDPDSIESWFEKTLDEFGVVHGLLVNTGGPPHGRFEAQSDADWQHAYELVLLSAVRLIRRVLPTMKEHRDGSIVTITSLAAREPDQDLLFSSVLRAGVSNLVKCLSVSLADHNIRINNLVPGTFDTERIQENTQHLATHISCGA